MNAQRLCFALAFGLLFLGLSLYAGIAEGQSVAPVTGAPDSLVLTFDASASRLNVSAIYAAVSEELHMILADEGSDLAATLVVSVTPSGEIQLTYKPSRDVITRTVPITSTSDVPRLVAHLAGNMVRDEAGSVLAEIATQQNDGSQAAAQTTGRATSLDPWDRDGDGFTDPTPPPQAPPAYLHDAWIFSVLGGGGLSLADDDPAFGNFVLQLSKRFGRLEVGAGARFAYGNMAIVARTEDIDQGIFAFSNVAIGYQVTLPISAEYRVLGDQDAYLQLGAATGLRLAGFMNQSRSVTSGSDAYFMFGVQATAGFALADNHGVMMRIGWDILPISHGVDNADGAYELAPLPFGVQLGWQIGW